ncbi:caspase family protein [Micromonospora sp. WMMD987]|uniref:caspase family protein n=1 Tax=Micromonospora sp. WMMD987 TaxID=3016089 RepID=UPI00249B0947|nr:caspase family protein [Micromonospora sp. WMMD987]WFE97524.1 caspase family protein [Micromonospora sp. WMMD987]
MADRALVIASQTYDLSGCHNDADLVGEVLKTRGFDVSSLRGEAASRAGVLSAFEALIAAIEPGDGVVVYYSGHGGRATTELAGAPRELRFLLPTDIAEGGTEDFRGILADELSVLLWRLTLRSPNVTAILDCCHSSRMARGEGARVRGWEADWPVPAVTRRWREAADAFGRLQAAHPDYPWNDANPDAVRVVACGSLEIAMEGWSAELGGVHGYLTAALAPILRDDPYVTWTEAIERARLAIMARNPLQHPEAAGPADRVAFTTTVRHSGRPHPIRVDRVTGQAWIDGARVHGIRPGDELLLSPTGRPPDSAAPIVRVSRVEGAAAALTAAPGVTIKGVAHPWRSTGQDACVRVASADDAAVATLRSIPGVRVVTDGDEAAIVTVSAGYRLYDGAGLPLHRDPLPDLDRLRRHVDSLVTSARLRSLGDEPGDLSTPVELRLDGPSGPVTDGMVLHPGDRIHLAVVNGTGTGTVYVSVLDLGLAGRVSVLNESEPAGMALAPGDTRVIGERPGGRDPGLPLLWPAAVPAVSGRCETLVAVFSDVPQDLRGLTREGVTERGGGGSGTTGTLAALLRSGMREFWTGPDTARFTVRQVTFVLCPGGTACSCGR